MGKRKGRGSAQTQPGGAYAGVMRWELVVAVYVHMGIYVKSALLQSAGIRTAHCRRVREGTMGLD